MGLNSDCLATRYGLAYLRRGYSGELLCRGLWRGERAPNTTTLAQRAEMK